MKEVPNYKRVALRVLRASAELDLPTFRVKLSINDYRESRVTCRNPAKERTVVNRTESELNMMGAIGSYGDAFRFIGKVQDQFRPIEYSPKLPLVPLTKIKTCFIRVDKLALAQLARVYRDCLGGMRDPLRINENFIVRCLENEENFGCRS